MPSETGEGTPPQELHPSLPDINRQNISRIIGGLSWTFYDNRMTSAKTEALDQQEQDYLRAKVKADKSGRLDLEGHNKVDLKDQDKLWLALNVLYSKDQAETTYQIIRLAQLQSLGVDIDDINPEIFTAHWLHEAVLKEAGNDPKGFAYLNTRQIIFGEHAALTLLNQELKQPVHSAQGDIMSLSVRESMDQLRRLAPQLTPEDLKQLRESEPYYLVNLITEGRLTFDQIKSLPPDQEAANQMEDVLKSAIGENGRKQGLVKLNEYVRQTAQGNEYTYIRQISRLILEQVRLAYIMFEENFSEEAKKPMSRKGIFDVINDVSAKLKKTGSEASRNQAIAILTIDYKFAIRDNLVELIKPASHILNGNS